MLYRTFGFTAEKATRAKESGDLLVEMAFSSEEPYERWWGVEILDHAESSVRLDRLNDGAPLLFNHNWNALRGTHEKGTVRVDQDRRVRGMVRLESVTPEGKNTIGLVESGHLTKTSTGYAIHKVIEQTTSKSGEKVERELDGALFERVLTRSHQNHGGDLAAFRRALDAEAGAFERAADQPTIYRVVDWEPHENSLVTVPADNTVGVGRMAESVDVQPEVPAKPSTSVQQPAQPAERSVAMTDPVNAAAGASAEVKITAVEAEKERREAIVNLCKSNKIDSRVEARWIAEGTPLSQVAKELLGVMEERGRANPVAASELGLTRKEQDRFSLFRVIRYLRDRSDPAIRNAAAFELECSVAVAKRLGREGASSVFIPGEVLTRSMSPDVMQRAMATTPGSKGGYVVNVENMGFIDILRNRSVVRSMGARVLSGLEGNVTFARQTGKPSVTWQGGEGTSVTAADQTLGQLSMTPKTAIVITDVSEQLLRQSNPSAEQFVMADLAADIAIDGVDAAAINGTGGAQPIGIKNTTGITSGQDASSATYAKILAFVSTAAGANAIRGNPGFVTNAAGAAILMQKSRFSNTDTPLWEGNLLDGTCVGFRAMASEQLASGNLIFGSFDELVIGEWGVLELATDTGGTRFNQAQVGIRAMWMVDVMLRYPQAFVVSTTLSA